MPKLVQLKDHDGPMFPISIGNQKTIIGRRGTNQSAFGTGAIQFDILDKTSDLFSISNSTSRFTALRKCVVLILGSINFYSTTTGFFVRVDIRKNGTSIGNRVPAVKLSAWYPVSFNGVVSLNAGDYIEIFNVSDQTVEIAGNGSDGSYVNIIPL